MNQAENRALYRKIEIIKNILAELLNFLPLFAIACILQEDVAGGGSRAFFLLPGGVMLFYYFLREISEKLWAFLTLHILPLAGLLFFYRGSLSQKVITAVIVTVIMGVSIGRRVMEGDRGMEAAPPALAVGVIFVLYLFDMRLGQGRSGAFLLEMTVIFVSGFFLYYFLDRFLHYVDMNTRTNSNIAVSHIFYPAVGVAGGFTALAAGISLLGADRELMERLAQAIRRGIGAFLRFFFSLLPKEEMEQEVPAYTEASFAAAPDWMGEPVKESLLMKILDTILRMAAGIIILVLLTAAVISLIKVIRSGFGQKRKKPPAARDGYSDKAERIKPEETKRRGGEGLWERMGRVLSPEERIRRIYRKTLTESVPGWMGEKKADILRGATARECCVAVFPDREEAYAFAQLYEKARYGRGICDGEDVKQAKILAGKLLQGNRSFTDK